MGQSSRCSWAEQGVRCQRNFPRTHFHFHCRQSRVSLSPVVVSPSSSAKPKPTSTRHRTTRTTTTTTTSRSLCHSIIVFDDLHSLSVIHSSDTPHSLRPNTSPRSQPSFQSIRVFVPTSINNPGLRFDHAKKRKTRNEEPHRSSRKKRHRPLIAKGSLGPLTFVQQKVLFKICVWRGSHHRVFI
jgi:hypothetical protein